MLNLKQCTLRFTKLSSLQKPIIYAVHSYVNPINTLRLQNEISHLKTSDTFWKTLRNAVLISRNFFFSRQSSQRVYYLKRDSRFYLYTDSGV